MKIGVPLTAAESDIWLWALDAMLDYWSPDYDDERDDGLHFEEPVMTPVKDGFAEIEDHPEILDDLRYRYREQLRDMVLDEAKDARALGEIDRAKRAEKLLRASYRILDKIEDLKEFSK